ncbi:Short-chain dehydrogenase [Nocardioides scoriae]|uniref:Short-chain dehydrogenase n=1 Tax=Nocardioides scoriae TaxID=642780 RepID=A0A1H1VXJ6_9ACTN|nr:SDR family NAD(P)-dependent oxidoreductase [Nocardioides scoriae]SDS88789.1 Short-chain dehydrogenase [Nocardioides scoriae]
MELTDARVLVAGASGALGGQITDALLARGARVVAAGRDADRVGAVAARCGTEPVLFDAVDTESCQATVTAAVEQLGGLDVLVVCVGVAGFGRAAEADDAVVEELFAVNVLGPMALVRAASAAMGDQGAVAVVSAILADLPTAGMAEYSAAKSALATWLGVLRREERRRLTVLDVRPPHLDTGLDGRALAGEPPKLPAPFPSADVVEALVQGLAEGSREVVLDAKAGALVRR